MFVSGELDLATVPHLEEALGAADADVLVIDLTGCTFLDSAGIRALVGAHRDLSAAGRSLRLVTGDSILRLLEITGVNTLIDIHPTLDDAL